MELGQGRGHGDQPPSRGGFKALPTPRSSLALPAPCAMQVLSLLLLLGLCCLWARLVASGERGTGPWGVPTQRAERGRARGAASCTAVLPPCVTPDLTAQRARALQGPGMPQAWDTAASPQVSPRSCLDPP